MRCLFPFATGNSFADPAPSPVAEPWEKVADRPNEGA
jgi:hypothetical protein